MQLLGKVGGLPFSAEGREQRIGAIMLLRSTAKHRPTRFALTRNGDIALAGDLGVAAPVTPTKLIAAITTLLASIKPFLDLFSLFIDPIGICRINSFSEPQISARGKSDLRL